MGFLKEYRRAKAGDYTYEVAGKRVVCPHCGGEEFDRSDVLMNTMGMTFVGLDWANRSAVALVCKGCGHIEWFLDEEGEL